MEPLVTEVDESISDTVSLPGAPLKSSAGMNRNLSAAATVRLVDAVSEVEMSVQVEPV